MLAEILAAIAVCAFVVVAAYGLGQWVIRTQSAGAELWALRTLAGLGLLGVGLFLVGCVRWNLAVVLVVLTPLAAAGLLGLVKRGTRKVSHYYAVAILLVAVCAIAALSRPVGGIGNDTISYHLLGPSKWPGLDRITVITDHSHTAFPATVEVLFAAGMMLSNDRFPGLLDIVFTVLLLVQIRGLSALLFPGERIGALAVTFAATMPVIMLFSNNGFVDVAYCCFTLAAMRLALESASNAPEVGLFAGFAIGTKYTGLLFVAILAVSLLFYRRKPVRFGLLLLIAAVVVGCPWYVRNWLVLGSPIYPIPLALSKVFHSPFFPMPAVLHFDEYILGRGKGLGRGIQWLAALPFTFTFFTAAFHGAGGIGLEPICFAPVGLLALRGDRRVRFLGLMALLLTVTWFFTQQEARFLMPVLSVSAVFAAGGASYLLWQQSRFGRIVCWAAVAVSVVYGGVFIVQSQAKRLASLRSNAAEKQWLATNIPYAAAFGYLNGSADVKRVLLLDPTVPPYYLKKSYIKPKGPYGETSPDDGSASHILDVRSDIFHTEYQVTDPAGMHLVFSSEDARVYAVNR
jgi:hypothetical protein